MRKGAGGKGKRKGKRRGRRGARPLGNQANYVISRSMRIGVSKRSDRANGVETIQYVYSNGEASEMRDFANALTRYVSAHFPEVRLLSQITDRHVKAYAEEMGAGWARSTRVEYASRMRKLTAMSRNVFGSGPSLSPSGLFGEDSPEAPARGASGGMDQGDWEALNRLMLSSKSGARFVPFMTRSVGTRIEEACSLEPWNIDVAGRVVRLRHCKNGRNRDVPIPEADVRMWGLIKSEAERRGWPTVCAGIRKDSASRAIRRGLEALGLSGKYPLEGNHAIRKLYARELYESLLGEGLGPREAWERVQVRLGHGPRFRRRLFDTYVGHGLGPSTPRPGS